MAKTIHVYTRPVDKESYPEGLANSVHFALFSETGSEIPWNKNYGILFARGEISENNTIIPMGIKNPCIFHIDEKRIGIAGERIHEDGSPDETSAGKLILWETEDLISFTEKGFTERDRIDAMISADPDSASDQGSISVTDELADKATI